MMSKLKNVMAANEITRPGAAAQQRGGEAHKRPDKHSQYLISECAAEPSEVLTGPDWGTPSRDAAGSRVARAPIGPAYWRRFLGGRKASGVCGGRCAEGSGGWKRRSLKGVIKSGFVPGRNGGRGGAKTPALASFVLGGSHPPSHKGHRRGAGASRDA